LVGWVVVGGGPEVIDQGIIIDLDTALVEFQAAVADSQREALNQP
jgi:hypothetical protein